MLETAQSEFIVKFFGAMFHETNVYLYMEFMEYGSLEALYWNQVSERVLKRITYCVRLRFFSSSVLS